MAKGITSYGTYIPRWRLDRSEVAAAVGERDHGQRIVASFDEDATTLGVAAAARALVDGRPPSALWFATTAPAYVDKTNATTLHAALSLPKGVAAFDLGASTRSAAAALRTAAASGGLAVLADVRGGLPGGADERAGADAAAAFQLAEESGDAQLIAKLMGAGAATAEFLDRWANPGDAGSRTWEERFGESEYLPLAEHAVDAALKHAAVSISDVTSVVIAGPNARAVKAAGAALRKRAGVTANGETKEIVDLIGNAGAASLGLALADALDTARADDLLLVVSLADGADAFVLHCTAALAERRPPTTVRAQLDVGLSVSYPRYLMWRGQLRREPPRRPDPARPSAPFAKRDAAYKFAFQGGKCRQCGAVQFPLPSVCMKCQARETCEPVSGARATGRVVTYTVDRLAFSPNPPLVSAVVDLDVGGRVTVEVTDIPVDALTVGLRVRTTFRRLMTADGIHNYFWKAGPV